MTEPTNPPSSTPSPLRTWRAWREKRWFSWGVDLLLALGVVAGISMWQTRGHLDEGVSAPPFSLASFEDPASGRTDLETLKGKKTVLYFWAPWCTVCEAQSSAISALQRSHGEEIHVKSVVLGYEDEASIQAFIEEHEVDYPVLLGHEAMTTQWQVSAFPTVYMLDTQGRVASSMVGYTTRAGLLSRLALID